MSIILKSLKVVVLVLKCNNFTDILITLPTFLISVIFILIIKISFLHENKVAMAIWCVKAKKDRKVQNICEFKLVDIV